jgi:hypothetical protein
MVINRGKYTVQIPEPGNSCCKDKKMMENRRPGSLS